MVVWCLTLVNGNWWWFWSLLVVEDILLLYVVDGICALLHYCYFFSGEWQKNNFCCCWWRRRDSDGATLLYDALVSRKFFLSLREIKSITYNKWSVLKLSSSKETELLSVCATDVCFFFPFLLFPCLVCVCVCDPSLWGTLGKHLSLSDLLHS